LTHLVCSTERILEDSGDPVAPPARPHPKARVSLLPVKPVLANFARVRRSVDEVDAALSDGEGNSVDEAEADEEADRRADQGGRDQAADDPSVDVTADDSAVEQEDHRSPSPTLQGASRTDGGRIRGRAAGNAFTFGETTTVDPIVPLMGRVVLYDSRAANAVPVFAVKQPVAPDLKSVLSSLASKFSPIRSESAIPSCHCYSLLNTG
jgi:hypothetical protein